MTNIAHPQHPAPSTSQPGSQQDHGWRWAYSLQAKCVVDRMLPPGDGGHGVFSGMTLDELRIAYPDIQLAISPADADRCIIEAVVTPPKEITLEHYTEMLEVLPPLKWTARGGAESFRLSEFYTSTVARTYVRLRDSNRCFEMLEEYGVTHETIVQRCRLLHERPSVEAT
jgi:hypothetical protein